MFRHTLPKSESAPSCAADGVRRIRREMGFRSLVMRGAIIALAVCLAAGLTTVLLRPHFGAPAMDAGESVMFSEVDRQAALDDLCARLPGRIGAWDTVLLSAVYSGDEFCRGAGEGYMTFRVRVEDPVEGGTRMTMARYFCRTDGSVVFAGFGVC